MQQPQVLHAGGAVLQVRAGGGRAPPPHSLASGEWLPCHPLCLVGIFRPAFGGRACVGDDLQAEMCNTQVGLPPPGCSQRVRSAARGGGVWKDQGGCNSWLTPGRF